MNVTTVKFCSYAQSSTYLQFVLITHRETNSVTFRDFFEMFSIILKLMSLHEILLIIL